MEAQIQTVASHLRLITSTEEIEAALQATCTSITKKLSRSKVRCRSGWSVFSEAIKGPMHKLVLPNGNVVEPRSRNEVLLLLRGAYARCAIASAFSPSGLVLLGSLRPIIPIRSITQRWASKPLIWF
jgi:hypothetical protein